MQRPSKYLWNLQDDKNGVPNEAYCNSFVFWELWSYSGGCIQPQAGPQVKTTTASAEWKPDGVVGANEYARTMTLQAPASNGYSGGTMTLSWKNDAEYSLPGTQRHDPGMGFLRL